MNKTNIFCCILLALLTISLIQYTYTMRPQFVYTENSFPSHPEVVEEEVIIIIPQEPKTSTIEKPKVQREISYEDAQILMKIAQAEARDEGVRGKAMVMAVVLNRVDSDIFPDTVEEVVFQRKQFSPTYNGEYKKAEPDTECHLALAQIEQGDFENIDALFFDSCDNSWASRHREYLYDVGNHHFYR